MVKIWGLFLFLFFILLGALAITSLALSFGQPWLTHYTSYDSSIVSWILDWINIIREAICRTYKANKKTGIKCLKANKIRDWLGNHKIRDWLGNHFRNFFI